MLPKRIVLAVASLFVAAANSKPIGHGETLDSLFKKHGKLFYGSATDTELKNHTIGPEYNHTLANEFGAIAPCNCMKFENTQPKQGEFEYEYCDQILEFAQQNDQPMRGHAFVWHTQVPAWVTEGGFSKQEIHDIMENHIREVGGHYKGKLIHWDVVNEALQEDGTLRNGTESVWYNSTDGPEYIYNAFKIAREVDPDAKLYYNDFDIDRKCEKSEGALKLLQDIKDSGAPIDGVGLQGHFNIENPPTYDELVTLFNRYTDLDLDLLITEFDVSMEIDNIDFQKQADVYREVVRACLDVKRCQGILLWDWTDRYSWIPTNDTSKGYACQWDDNLDKKPAYYSVKHLLQHHD
jgi:endo-1,4-beta-xylanase